MTIHDTQDWSSPGGQGPAQVIGQPVLTFGTLLLGEDPSGDAQAIQVDSSGHILTTGGYASLTGPGQSTTPGELDQAGGFTVTCGVADTTGFQVIDPGSGGIFFNELGDTGFLVDDSGAGGIELAEFSSGGITLNDTGTGGIHISSATYTALGDSIKVMNSGGPIFEAISSGDTDSFIVALSGAHAQIDISAEDGVLISVPYGGAGVVTLQGHGGVYLDGDNGGQVGIGLHTADLIGFYGRSGISQQVRPTTLAEVIAVMVNLGLTA